MSEPINVLIVYAQGKVGGSSVRRSLLAGGMEPFHVHSLDPELIRSLIEARGPIGWFREADEVLRIRAGEVAVAKWFIITGVRDPIRTWISNWFQELYRNHPELYEESLQDDDPDMVLKLIDQIQQEISGGLPNYHDWLTGEFFNFTGFNVFQHPFPHEKGYEVYIGGDTQILVYRCEDLEHQWEEMSERFFGIKCPYEYGALSHATKDEKRGALFQRILETIRLPKDIVQRIYSNLYSQHFYSAGELAKFSERWIHGKTASQPFDDRLAQESPTTDLTKCSLELLSSPYTSSVRDL